MTEPRKNKEGSQAAGSDQNGERNSAVLSALFDQAPLGLALLNEKKELVRSNLFFHDLSGAAHPGPSPRLFRALMNESGAWLLALVDRVKTDGKPVLNHEATLPRAPSRDWPRHLNASCLPVSEGWLLLVLEDRTDILQLEVALKAGEDRYRTLENMAPVGIFHSDLTGGFLAVNKRWCEITGLNASEALGTGWMRAIHSEDRVRVFADWDRAVSAQDAFQCEFRICRAGGRVVEVFASALVQTQTDEASGYFGTFADVTYQRLVERNLSSLTRV